MILMLVICAAAPASSGFAQQRIVTTAEPPVNFTMNGEVTGTTVDIVREIMSRQNIGRKIEMLPWARAFEIAKRTPNTAIFTAGRTKEREDLGFSFIGPVVTREHVLWKRRGSDIQVSSLQEILDGNYIIAGLRQGWRTKYFQEAGARVTATNTYTIGLRLLLSGRADFWISSDIEALTIARDAGVDLQDLERAFLIKEAPSYIMLSKGTDPAVLAQWQSTFEALPQSDFYDRLTEKWSAILGLDVAYSPERGIYIHKQ